MAKQWSQEERIYFLRDVLPKSKYATGSFVEDGGLPFDVLAIQMQNDLDARGQSRREYTSDRLFQHWYQKVRRGVTSRPTSHIYAPSHPGHGRGNGTRTSTRTPQGPARGSLFGAGDQDESFSRAAAPSSSRANSLEESEEAFTVVSSKSRAEGKSVGKSLRTNDSSKASLNDVLAPSFSTNLSLSNSEPSTDNLLIPLLSTNVLPSDSFKPATDNNLTQSSATNHLNSDPFEHSANKILAQTSSTNLSLSGKILSSDNPPSLNQQPLPVAPLSSGNMARDLAEQRLNDLFGEGDPDSDIYDDTIEVAQKIDGMTDQKTQGKAKAETRDDTVPKQEKAPVSQARKRVADEVNDNPFTGGSKKPKTKAAAELNYPVGQVNEGALGTSSPTSPSPAQTNKKPKGRPRKAAPNKPALKAPAIKKEKAVAPKKKPTAVNTAKTAIPIDSDVDEPAPRRVRAGNSQSISQTAPARGRSQNSRPTAAVSAYGDDDYEDDNYEGDNYEDEHYDEPRGSFQRPSAGSFNDSHDPLRAGFQQPRAQAFNDQYDRAGFQQSPTLAFNDNDPHDPRRAGFQQSSALAFNDSRNSRPHHQSVAQQYGHPHDSFYEPRPNPYPYGPGRASDFGYGGQGFIGGNSSYGNHHGYGLQGHNHHGHAETYLQSRPSFSHHQADRFQNMGPGRQQDLFNRTGASSDARQSDPPMLRPFGVPSPAIHSSDPPMFRPLGVSSPAINAIHPRLNQIASSTGQGTPRLAPAQPARLANLSNTGRPTSRPISRLANQPDEPAAATSPAEGAERSNRRPLGRVWLEGGQSVMTEHCPCCRRGFTGDEEDEEES